MKRLVHHDDLLDFQSRYFKASGLPVPLEYLERSKVFAFYKRKKMIGGFVLCAEQAFRTVDVFVETKHREKVNSQFSNKSCIEVCCFWIDRKIRRKLFYNSYCWLRMAYKVKYSGHQFVLFGTNSRGLANMYGYPRNSLLFHEDIVNQNNTYVFLVLTNHFAGGIWEIIVAKIFRRERRVDKYEKELLKEKLIHELSK